MLFYYFVGRKMYTKLTKQELKFGEEYRRPFERVETNELS